MVVAREANWCELTTTSNSNSVAVVGAVAGVGVTMRRSNDLSVVSDVNELCPICKLVPQEPNPNSHINLHHYRQINQMHNFVCEACDRRFPEKRLAKEHAYVAHGELTRVKQVYSCPVCSLPYSQPIKVTTRASTESALASSVTFGKMFFSYGAVCDHFFVLLYYINLISYGNYSI